MKSYVCIKLVLLFESRSWRSCYRLLVCRVQQLETRLPRTSIDPIVNTEQLHSDIQTVENTTMLKIVWPHHLRYSVYEVNKSRNSFQVPNVSERAGKNLNLIYRNVFYCVKENVYNMLIFISCSTLIIIVLASIFILNTNF